MKQYHIGLDSKEKHPNVLLPGDIERVKKIAAHLENPSFVCSNREYTTYKGEKNGVPITVMSTGMGCPSVAIGVEELAQIGGKHLIRVGTCGAMQEDIKPGTIIIPTGSVRGDGTTLEYVPSEYPAIANLEVVNALINSANKMNEKPTIGIIRTHDAFYMESPFAHGDYLTRIKPWVDANVVAVENESSALFVISSILGLKAGTILTVRGNLLTGEQIKDISLLDERIDLMIQIAVNAISELY
jgi:uridine phosphorylase